VSRPLEVLPRVLNRGPGTSGATAAVLVAGGLLAAWAIASTAVHGVVSPAAALVFVALIATGEVLRMSYPAGRIHSPLALSGALAYAFLGTLRDPLQPHSVHQVVAVAAIGMVAGAALHGLARRSYEASSVARRLVVVGMVGFLQSQVLAPSEQVSGWEKDPRLAALLMLVMLVIGFAADYVIRAAQTAGPDTPPAGQRFFVEMKAAPGIDMSVAATAVVLAIATSIMRLWAVPLFSIPLLLTLWSYRHFNGARATYDQTIEALSKATEIAGFTLVGHARRVADLSVAMAKTLGMDLHEVNDLEHAALLHDLGQMSLVDPLPGGATTGLPREERVQIATAGAHLIEEAQIPGPVALMVGRQADSLAADTAGGTPPPLASRIIAVANGYDDLLIGGSGGTPATVVAQLRERAGCQFDPAAVEALARHLDPSAPKVRKRLRAPG
jgi:HD domain-containing protein